MFGLEQVEFGDLIVDFGARFDHITTEAGPGRTAAAGALPADPDRLENEYSVVTGSLGAVDRVSEDLSLTASIARGFRAPNLFELYADGQNGGVAAIQRDDPTLEEETSISIDASLRYDPACRGVIAHA